MINTKVGDYVYAYGTPQKPGKVLSVFEQDGRTWVEIRWIDGTIATWWELRLKDFNKLIADHEKKLNTHRSKLPKLEAL